MMSRPTFAFSLILGAACGGLRHPGSGRLRNPLRIRSWALLLSGLVLAGCEQRPPEMPPPEPDWARVETWLASQKRQDRALAIREIMLANEDRPGLIARLAEMPEDASPGLRHYTAACLMVTLHGDLPASEQRRLWTPSKRTLDLLVTGLDDERDLPVGGAADWDLPVSRFCLSALELLTGEESPPRPVNIKPSRALVARWRRWWVENRAYLCFDEARGVWTVDETAKRLAIPLAAP